MNSWPTGHFQSQCTEGVRVPGSTHWYLYLISSFWNLLVFLICLVLSKIRQNSLCTYIAFIFNSLHVFRKWIRKVLMCTDSNTMTTSQKHFKILTAIKRKWHRLLELVSCSHCKYSRKTSRPICWEKCREEFLHVNGSRADEP